MSAYSLTQHCGSYSVTEGSKKKLKVTTLSPLFISCIMKKPQNITKILEILGKVQTINQRITEGIKKKKWQLKVTF